jgi:hypothetical protein
MGSQIIGVLLRGRATTPLMKDMNADGSRDYYRLLGVPQGATVSEIHKAYWNLASRFHPDRGGSHEVMVRLVEAWKILSDSEKRSRYDQLLKYRNDGWRSRKFNEDVLDARKGAEDHAARSWAEFEEIYQKAFYTFNKDFYGDEITGKAAGPYSPLMGSKGKGDRIEGTSGSRPADISLNSSGGRMFARLIITVIVFVALGAAVVFYRMYNGVGRYVPLESRNSANVLMLDTTNGAVYSVEKRDGTFFSTWKETIPPIPPGGKMPRK